MSVRQLKHQRQLQIAGFEQLLVPQHVLHFAIGCQPALMQEQHAVAGFINKIKVMRRNQLRTRQAAQNIYQITPVLRIERCRRLIHEQKLRRERQNPGNRHQFLLSAAQSVNLPLLQALQLHLRQRLLHAFSNLFRSIAIILCGKGHVAINIGHKQLAIRILKYIAEASAQLTQIFFF